MPNFQFDLGDELEELLADATIPQVQWVLERVTRKTDAEAAKAIGYRRETVYRWPNKAKLEQAVRLLQLDSVRAALAILSQATPEAAQTMVDLLKSRRHRLQAAKEILDRGGIPAESRHSVEAQVGMEEDIRDAILSKLARVADAEKASEVHSEPE